MKKGSITVYLCLTLLVMLSLFSASLYAVRISAARVTLSSAAEQGLFSMFAQYDRDLYERYGLLFIEGSYGSGSMQLGRVKDETEKEMSYIVQPAEGMAGAGRDIIGMKPGGCGITGYTLATDVGGSPVVRQIKELMKTQVGQKALDLAEERLGREGTTATRSERQSRDLSSADPASLYNGSTDGINPEDVADVEDPRDNINSLRSRGILSLVLPKGAEVSSASVDLTGQPSHRGLETGMGVLPKDQNGLKGKTAERLYLTTYFSCFTDREHDGALSYELEYAIAGKSSDKENLKSTVRRLMLMRQADNFLFLIRNPARSAEADELASEIAVALLNPALAPIIALGIKQAWAFGESVVDLRELLAGGREPLVKTEESWQLSLSELGSLSSVSSGKSSGDRDGLSYREYLDILLTLLSSRKMTGAVMDLIEQNMHLVSGHEAFRLDCCIDALEIEAEASCGGQNYSIVRSFGYDMV